MSKITKTALLIWMSQTNNRDFLFGDIPSNRLANLLHFSEDSDNLSTSLNQVRRKVKTTIVIHTINVKNAIIVDIFRLVP